MTFPAAAPTLLVGPVRLAAAPAPGVLPPAAVDVPPRPATPAEPPRTVAAAVLTFDAAAGAGAGTGAAVFTATAAVGRSHCAVAVAAQ